MPMKKSYRKRASPYKKRRLARRRVARTNVPEWASLSETTDIGSLVVGTTYNLNDVQLAQFTRAAAVAQGYQFFRIKKLTFKVQPLIDTFIATAPGATQVPYLLWAINKAGYAYPGLIDEWFYDNGAKPIRFDDKTITIKYAPAVVLDAAEAATPGIGNQANYTKTSPWLNTNTNAFVAAWAPSQVSHTGHVMKVTSPGSTQAMAYRMTMTAEFQFKKPLALIRPDTIDSVNISTLLNAH